MTALEFLQAWYRSCLNGQWEHEWGVKIDTLDNPGWRLEIDLKSTPLEDAAMDPVRDLRSESNWIHCLVERGRFVGRGGPENLEELIGMFQRWAESKGHAIASSAPFKKSAGG